jgi:hypothetical protein
MTDTIDPTVAAVATVQMAVVVVGVIVTLLNQGRRLRMASQ